jgi:hypothetical protein
MHKGHKQKNYPMKKNIILLAAFVLLCLTNLLAQKGSPINSDVSKSFENKFAGATELSWEPQLRGITLARFRYKGETWVAYFDREGSIITSGRKVKSADTLPVKVRESLEKVQSKYEGKYGAFALGSIFEMINENGATVYFVPMQNAGASMMLSIGYDGYATIQKKDIHSISVQPNPPVIAKKN